MRPAPPQAAPEPCQVTLHGRSQWRVAPGERALAESPVISSRDFSGQLHSSAEGLRFLKPSPGSTGRGCGRAEMLVRGAERGVCSRGWPCMEASGIRLQGVLCSERVLHPGVFPAFPGGPQSCLLDVLTTTSPSNSRQGQLLTQQKPGCPQLGVTGPCLGRGTRRRPRPRSPAATPAPSEPLSLTGLSRDPAPLLLGGLRQGGAVDSVPVWADGLRRWVCKERGTFLNGSRGCGRPRVGLGRLALRAARAADSPARPRGGGPGLGSKGCVS